MLCMSVRGASLIHVLIGDEVLQSEAIAAMESAREMIKSFDGVSGVEVETWLRKIKLVAKLKKISDLHNFIPLYLDGAAFAIYDQLSDKDKDDAAKIEAALTSAFAQDSFGAYDVFRQRSWQPGESVDVYLADLWRLARLAKIESEELVRCAFICGLPPEVSAQLRVTANISSTELSTVAEQARIHLANKQFWCGAVAVANRQIDDQGPTNAESRHQRRTLELAQNGWKQRAKTQCFRCGGNHLARQCRDVTCWNCSGSGHVARNCTRYRESGNDNGKSYAPAVSRTE